MILGNSRYAKAGTYVVTGADGRSANVLRAPVRRSTPARGYHRRLDGQRLDHLAAHYLNDATASWLLCDANDAMVPDVLGAAALVGIPRSGS